MGQTENHPISGGPIVGAQRSSWGRTEKVALLAERAGLVGNLLGRRGICFCGWKGKIREILIYFCKDPNPRERKGEKGNVHRVTTEGSVLQKGKKEREGESLP